MLDSLVPGQFASRLRTSFVPKRSNSGSPPGPSDLESSTRGEKLPLLFEDHNIIEKPVKGNSDKTASTSQIRANGQALTWAAPTPPQEEAESPPPSPYIPQPRNRKPPARLGTGQDSGLSDRRGFLPGPLARRGPAKASSSSRVLVPNGPKDGYSKVSRFAYSSKDETARLKAINSGPLPSSP
ncbi:MAG: hypothetical protein MMC23_002031 [Stictis urceolatum]|nr:hypothetical protein [Stictis urceolata]